jgi:hypothetical protein
MYINEKTMYRAISFLMTFVLAFLSVPAASALSEKNSFAVSANADDANYGSIDAATEETIYSEQFMYPGM